MEKQDIIKYCLDNFDNVYLDYPFDDNWAAIRHNKNKKTFVFIFEKDNNCWLNIKFNPEECDFFKSVYNFILPAYHMNKQHWNSVILNGDVPLNELFNMLENSYNITKPKIKLY